MGLWVLMVRLVGRGLCFVRWLGAVSWVLKDCNQWVCGFFWVAVVVGGGRRQSGIFGQGRGGNISHTHRFSIQDFKDRRSNISSIIQTPDKVYNLDWFSSALKMQCSAAVDFKWMLNQVVHILHVSCRN
ncbi:hypothetical protein CMV_023398 [Castanea mollissima]|uniref:Uncharacterized protein n=1 Tax=Castanea mollissima TaxID=60419 RepID=A0A8J4QG28_9ROSI|nr:hypothetical protein CMV_023398 [Castanea mollissima]